MHSPTIYELEAECWNCNQIFGEHCAADNGCPIYDANGEWSTFSNILTFANLMAVPVKNYRS